MRLYLDGALVATAADANASASGGIGLLSAGAVFDTFRASQAVARLPFFDDFDRVDTTFLGDGWTEYFGDYAVAGNAVAAAPGVLSLAALNGLDASDVILEAEIELPSSGQHFMGPLARLSNAGFLWGTLMGNNGAYFAAIYRFANGTFTLLNSAPIPSGSGTARLEIMGSSLRLYFNETLAVSAEAPAGPEQGMIGIMATGGILDNFGAMALGPTREIVVDLQLELSRRTIKNP